MDEKTLLTKDTLKSEDVIKFYDTYAEHWNNRYRHTKSTRRFHQMRLDNFIRLAKFKKDEVAIELGVGTGQYLDKIAFMVKEIICIDGSQKMLEILLKNNKNLNNITIHRLDLEEKNQTIGVKSDIIYCFGLIEHIINTDIFIENCKRMLKSNGRIIFVTPNGMCPWYGKLRKLFRYGKHCSSDKYYLKDEIDRLMHQHGFVLQDFLYWGYYPAGVGNLLFYFLDWFGKILDKTRFRQYAGGLTLSYIKKRECVDVCP